MEVSNLHVFNSVSVLWEPFTRAMLSGAELTPIGSIASITVTGTASTLSALMTAAGTSIAANCTWIEMRVRDDQTSQTVKLNYTGTATALLYDAAMSRAAGSLELEPASLIGRATKTLFDAYSLIATASTVVLVRQYTGDAMPMFGQSRSGSAHYVLPSGGDDTPQIQALNDAARNNSGGDIQLLPGAIFRLDTPLVLDVGAGVSLRGNGAYLDARNITGTQSAITIASNPPASIKIAGVDDNVNNYLQDRSIVERFALILQTGGSQTHHGIDINMYPAVSTRSPRCTVRNIDIWGGDRQIRHRNKAYLCRFQSVGCVKGRKSLSLEGGEDQGEQTIFTGCGFSNPTEAVIYIDTQPETGTPENVDVTFGEGCSFDYTNSQIVKFVSGYGRVRFQASHFEWSYAGTSSLPPFDLSAAASAQMLWLFDSPNIINAGSGLAFLAAFRIGDKHDVRIYDPFIHNLVGAGVQVSATGGPGSTPTVVETLAEITGTGTIICKDVHTLNPPAGIPRLVSIDDANNWLSDPGFEQASLLDMWYGSGAVGTLATTAAQAHTGSRSLDIPITGAVSVAKSAKCLVPIKHGARFMAAACFAKLSAGSGSASLAVRPVVVAVQAVPGTAPTIQRTGTLVTMNTATLSTTGWTKIAHTTNSPRVSIPAWATHIEVVIDCFSIDNNGGSVYLDPVWVSGW